MCVSLPASVVYACGQYVSNMGVSGACIDGGCVQTSTASVYQLRVLAGTRVDNTMIQPWVRRLPDALKRSICCCIYKRPPERYKNAARRAAGHLSAPQDAPGRSATLQDAPGWFRTLQCASGRSKTLHALQSAPGRSKTFQTQPERSSTSQDAPECSGTLQDVPGCGTGRSRTLRDISGVPGRSRTHPDAIQDGSRTLQRGTSKGAPASRMLALSLRVACGVLAFL